MHNQPYLGHIALCIRKKKPLKSGEFIAFYGKVCLHQNCFCRHLRLLCNLDSASVLPGNFAILWRYPNC